MQNGDDATTQQQEAEEAARAATARAAADAEAVAAAQTASLAAVQASGQTSASGTLEEVGTEVEDVEGCDAVSDYSMAPGEQAELEESIVSAMPEAQRAKVKALLQRKKDRRATGRLKKPVEDHGSAGGLSNPKKPAK